MAFGTPLKVAKALKQGGEGLLGFEPGEVCAEA